MEFYYNHNGEIIGPVPMDEMGRYPIEPETLVWMDGMPNWLPAGSVPEFQPLFSHRPIQPAVRPPLPFDQKPPDNTAKLEAATSNDFKKPSLLLGILSILMIVVECAMLQNPTLGIIIYLYTAIAGFMAFGYALKASQERLLGNYSDALSLLTKVKTATIIGYVFLVIGIICTFMM